MNLFWHCAVCGAHDLVIDNADGPRTKIGDSCSCTECVGTVYAMTLEMAAKYEHRLALGMDIGESLKRAFCENRP